MSNPMNRNIDLDYKCKFCPNTLTVSVNKSDLIDWQNGKLIQNAMPYLSIGEREMMISETCEKCFDEVFKED